jgi:hypothetical protein
MIFVNYELVNNIFFFNKNILTPTNHVLERKATLNIEKVLQILNIFKDKVYGNERESIEYCIKIITNNTLFIPQIFEENKDNSPNENNLKHEIAFWVQNFEKIEKILNQEDSLYLSEKERSPGRKKSGTDDRRPVDNQKLNDKIAKFIDNPSESNKIVKSLTNAFSLDFNVFFLKEASNSQELLALMYYVFYHLDYFHIFNIKTHKFINFAKRVQASYHDTPYHNGTHGADVMQVMLLLN